jgi:hypothetical protein
MEIHLTSRHVWLSALIFGVLALALLVPLVLLSRASALGDPGFASAVRPLTAAAALFWGIVAIVALLRFWDLYYHYFYPAWVRYLVPLDLPLYGVIGLGMWWLAVHLPGPPLLGFVLLGGLEGIAEHLLGIYGFRILDRVPWLRGLAPLPVVVFSFFEYVLYWTLVGWLALGLAQIMT